MPISMPSRRRIITVLGAAAALPLLLSGDQHTNTTRLYRWRGSGDAAQVDSGYGVGRRFRFGGPAATNWLVMLYDRGNRRGAPQPIPSLEMSPWIDPTCRRLTETLRIFAQVSGYLAPAPHVQLAEQGVDMRLRGCHANVQPASDLLVTEPGPDQFGSLPLAFGKPGYPSWRFAAGAEASGEGDLAE
jgi:hypothetical protein